MATYWTSKVRGNDSNPGTELAPFKTVSKGMQTIISGDTLNIEEGYYIEGDIVVGHDLWASKINGIGEVIIDCLGFSKWFDVEQIDFAVISGIKVKNFSTTLFTSSGNSYNSTYFIGCSFIHDGSMYLSDTVSSFANTNCSFINSIFYGINQISVVSFYSHLLSCVVDSATTVEYRREIMYSAGISSYIYGAVGGINIATYAPPYTNISDPANPDLKYDKNHANYQMYVSSGQGGGVVGNIGLPSVQWQKDQNYNNYPITPYNLSSDTATKPLSPGAWENYSHYYDKTWEDIVITTGSNDTFQFDEGSGAITATIAAGTYSDGDSFATAIQTAINNSSATDTHTVIFSSFNLRLDWSTDGASLTINCNSYATNDAWDAMKMDTAADKSGSSRYYSDYGLAVGGGTGAESNPAPVSITSEGIVTIDIGVEPSGTTADVVSPVLEFYIPKKIDSISISKTIDGTGAIDSTKATTTRTVLVRADNSPFNVQDAPSTTALDWTDVSGEMDSIVSVIPDEYRYIQIRARLRTDATI